MSADSAPALADMDEDGDLDLLVGSTDGLRYFENVDGGFAERTGATNPIDGFAAGGPTMPTLGDWDGDGDTDVLFGVGAGILRFLSQGLCTQSDPCGDRGVCEPNGATCRCARGHNLTDCSGCVEGYHTHWLSAWRLGTCRPCPGLHGARGVCASRGVCDDDAYVRGKVVRDRGSNSSALLAVGHGNCHCSAGYAGFSKEGLLACTKGVCWPGTEPRRNESVWPAGAVECLPCPGGFQKGLDGDFACSGCPARTYAPPGSKRCAPCKPGYYQPAPEQAECVQCEPGRAAPQGSLACQDCEPGSYALKLVGGEPPGACLACPAGSFEPAARSAGCMSCAPGSFSGPGSTSCGVCAPGRFAGEGSPGCADCPPGRFQPESGAFACESCETDAFAAPGQTSCTACPAGTKAQPGSGECARCPVGYRFKDLEKNIQTKRNMNNYHHKYYRTQNMYIQQTSSNTVQGPGGRGQRRLRAGLPLLRPRGAPPGHGGRRGVAAPAALPAGDQVLFVVCYHFNNLRFKQ